MAKKKSDSSETRQPAAKKPAAEKKSSAAPARASAKAAPSKSASKPAAAPAGAPLIDTSLAANAAAAMIAGKVSTPSGSKSQPQQKKESAAFKQLKAGLNKPSAGALGGAFGVPGQQKKNVTQTHGGSRQVGHNQTFGADVTRTGVPRRTPG